MQEFFEIFLLAFSFVVLKLTWIALMTLIALIQVVVTLGWMVLMTLMALFQIEVMALFRTIVKAVYIYESD